MGRKRDAGNERLGEYVQRRSSGLLELRFPIPADVQHAFRDKKDRPRTVVIKSLGTSDIKIANAQAEAIKTHLRDEVRRAREARSSDSLGDYLRWLYQYELKDFRRDLDYSAKERVREGFVAPKRAAQSRNIAAATRLAHGAALTSESLEERRAAAGWAADEYFRTKGQEPDPTSPEYAVVLEECASVLVDGLLAKAEIAVGRPEPTSLSGSLATAIAQAGDLSGAMSDEGRLPLSTYFETIYAPSESREGSPTKGERNIPGKRHTVRLFKELMGDKAVCAIKKGHLYDFLEKLSGYPESRLLTGPLKKLGAARVLEKVKAGEIILRAMHPKTANKHLSNLSAILQFAERHRHVDVVDSKGVKARFEDDEDAGRPFTTDELNRLLSLPLFAGCAGEEVEGGLFKPGPVLIRDDRFWIPLVLLFSGARSSEIVGLMTSEVVMDHAVPHLLIVPNEIRRLKNRHSRRMVPIHSRLLAMGFREYVQRRVDEGANRLFPMAKQTTYREGATGKVVKRSLSQSLIMRQFNRTFLVHADAREDGGSTKCFRNTFEQEATSKIESDEVRQRLTGRKVMSTVRIYTDNIPRDAHQRSAQLLRLTNELERVTYDAVKLDHLIREQPKP